MHLRARKAVTVCVSVTILGVSEGGRAFECGLRAAVDCGRKAHLFAGALVPRAELNLRALRPRLGTEDVSGCFMCDDTRKLGLDRVVGGRGG